MTPSGIEPATFRFVSQHLNHCATGVSYMAGRDSHIIVDTGEEFDEGRKNRALEYELDIGIFKLAKIQRILLLIVINCLYVKSSR